MRKLLVILLALAVGVFLYAENVTVSWSGSAKVTLTLDQNGIDLGSKFEGSLVWSPLDQTVEGTPVSVSFEWSLGDGKAALDSVTFKNEFLNLKYVNDAFSYGYYFKRTLDFNEVPLKEASEVVEYIVTSDVPPTYHKYTVYKDTGSSVTDMVPHGIGSSYIEVSSPKFDMVTLYYVDVKSESQTDKITVDTDTATPGFAKKDKVFFRDFVGAKFDYDKLPMIDLTLFTAVYNSSPSDDKAYYDYGAQLDLSGKDILKGFELSGVYGSMNFDEDRENAFGVEVSYEKELSLGIATPTLDVTLHYSTNTAYMYYSGFSAWNEGLWISPSLSVDFGIGGISGNISASGKAIKVDTNDKYSRYYPYKKDSWIVSAGVSGNVEPMEGISVNAEWNADDVTDLASENDLAVVLNLDLNAIAQFPLSVEGAYKMMNVSKEYASNNDVYENGELVKEDKTLSAYHVTVSYKLLEGLTASAYFGTDYSARVIHDPWYAWNHSLVYYDVYSDYNPKYPKWYITLSYSTSF